MIKEIQYRSASEADKIFCDCWMIAFVYMYVYMYVSIIFLVDMYTSDFLYPPPPPMLTKFVNKNYPGNYADQSNFDLLPFHVFINLSTVCLWILDYLWWTLTKVKNKFTFTVSNILNLLIYDSVVFFVVDNGAIDLVDTCMSGSG